MAYIPSLLQRVRDCGPRLDFFAVTPLLLALVNVVPSVSSIIIEVAHKNPRERKGGVISSHKLSKAEKGRNASVTQPQIEQGLSPAASDICFACLLAEFSLLRLHFFHVILKVAAQSLLPDIFLASPSENWRLYVLFLLIEKIMKKDYDWPMWCHFPRGPIMMAQEQDCWGRWHFPVECNRREGGHVLQQGGCETQQKQRRWTVSQTVNLSLTCSLCLLADSISFPRITSSTLETFPRLSRSK